MSQQASPAIKIKSELTNQTPRPDPQPGSPTTKVNPELIEHQLALLPAPDNWEYVFKAISEWRESAAPAPVDHSGCTALATGTPSDPNYRFQVLVALMLSSQTKDEVTAAAMRNLQDLGLSIDSVLAWDSTVLGQAINKVGFWRKKTIYIQQTCSILKDKFNSDVPKSMEELLTLPGVGPKMGYLALYLAWGINGGIGVDVHVHRITNRLGWVKTKNPEETRKALESWLPHEFWQPINPVLVGFGQTQCLPVRPLCSLCPVQDLCPSYSLLVLPKQERPRSPPSPDSKAPRTKVKRARRK